MKDKLIRLIFWSGASLVILILLLILLFIVINGIKNISLEFLLTKPIKMGKEGGILTPMIGTFLTVILAISFATPIGLATALYLKEYAKETNLTKVLRQATEVLAGIPSVIYGLFGFYFFVIKLKLGFSVLSGGLTLALMILPTIIRTSEEAIASVPITYKESSLSLGATKLQTIRNIVLPIASSGILTGIILSIGRAAGETAAIMLTSGASVHMPTSLLSPIRTMSLHLYILATEGISYDNAYATALCLIIIILVVNILINLIIKFKP
jgi:phosphate transport system permease protein